MSNIENELNNRFKDQQLSDDTFDSQGLWEAIAEDLDQDKTNSTPSFLNKWIGILLLLLIIGGGLGILYWQSDESIATQDNSAQAINEPSELDRNEETSFSIGTTANPPSAPSNATTEIINTRTINNTNAKQSEETSTSKNIALHKEPKKQSQASDVKLSGTPSRSSSAKTAKSVSSTANSSTSTAIPAPSDQDKIAQKENTTASAKDILKTQLLAGIPSKFTFLKSDLPSLAPLQLLESKSRFAPKQQSIRWTIGLTGGANTLHFNYQSNDFSDVAALKEGAEKKFLGISYGANFGLLLNKRWSLNSGIEFHQLWSKFEYEQQKNIQVAKEDHLLKIWIDASSGDTIARRYGDTLANARSTRNIVHYNEYQRFSIPLELGIQHNSDKFIYGLRAGLVFNFTTQQSGRTLDQLGEIIAFEDDDPTSTFQSFGIGLRLSPLLGYQLSEQWSLSLQPQWMWQRRANFADTDIKIGIHQFNLNFGLNYFFN